MKVLVDFGSSIVIDSLAVGVPVVLIEDVTIADFPKISNNGINYVSDLNKLISRLK